MRMCINRSGSGIRVGSLFAALLLFLMSYGSVHALLPAQSTGNLYVSMWSGDEIAVFSSDGVLLDSFTAEGLDGPRGIAFNPDNGEIWVASEFGNGIYIFDAEHRFLRVLTHPDFDEPVGVTFIRSSGATTEAIEAVVSNSNGNELMVFDLDGQLLRRFTDATLNDPNCSAVMADGSLFVANRLGSSTGTTGSVARFNASDEFQFDFTTAGISSLMAVARNPGQANDGSDDTLWVSSGAGSKAIHEFDQSGNLLQSLLPADIDDGSDIVPQGLSVDDEGNLFVVSFNGEVLRFDADGNFQTRFATAAGTPRSSAFAICPMNCPPAAQTGETDAGESAAAQSGNDVMSAENTSKSGSGGGAAGIVLLALLLKMCLLRIQVQITLHRRVQFQ